MLAGEPRLKLQDVAGRVVALGLPGGHCLFGTKQARKENMRAIDPANNGLPVMIGDVEQPVTVFKISGSFDEYRRVQFPTHIPLSTRSTEQREVEREKLNAGNTILTVIDGRATGLRRTDGTISSFGFRNDNDNWSPLGAA